MSACTPFRELMLEADPGELRGVGNGALARHLRACDSCARVAALLLEETARLDALLDDAPEVDVAGILARAGMSPASTAPEPRIAPPSAAAVAPSAPARVGMLFPRRRIWIPLAAAAALAAVLLLRSPRLRSPGASVAAAPATAAPPLVEPAAGQDAAILQTDDPEITVIWLFPTG
jgi:hypothetical protein